MTKLLVMLTVLLVAALGVWRLSAHRSPAKPRQMTELERQAELAKRDREALAKSNATEPEIYGALVRLAQKLDPIAKQEAISRSGDKSKLVREGAANALGYFDDPDAMQALQKLLHDPEPSVRVQALSGIGHKRGPVREKLLREVLAKGGLKPEERVAAQSALILISDSNSDKLNAVGELVKLSKTEKNPALKERAIMQAVALAPRDPRVLEALRAELQSGHSPSLSSLAIRHLSAAQDAWVRSNLQKFQDDKDASVRLAVVQSLHMGCPVDRWSILEHVIRTERDRLVLDTAIQEPRTMPGKDAIALMERLSHNTEKLQPNEIMAIQNVLADLKKSNDVDPCLAIRRH